MKLNLSVIFSIGYGAGNGGANNGPGAKPNGNLNPREIIRRTFSLCKINTNQP